MRVYRVVTGGEGLGCPMWLVASAVQVICKLLPYCKYPDDDAQVGT